ncbi:DegT/DnrJ/EryC1/StrS family aminotransferase [Mesorhizobium comanense]|uniref:DegT/DnrJ/EryC1/StrS family aminotransferase n=1 Tax=Mesorhizobium comanense TaxID=2502215 RepID=UPI0010F6C9D3|nr:aminotransferase class I/II-fold pyridoxal phosphate-dependent enzyme [Mesorhizobium comanense]
MYIVGQEEIDAVTEVMRSGKLFRYGEGSQCDVFERRYAGYLGVDHFALSASGTFGLAAGLIGLGIGPGDEVLVPAHTYMATATAVLGVGAIPIIVDIDESLTIDPMAAEAAIGPHTRAIIPVHMWGAACDMDAIMALAEKHDLLVLEDACQGVGGGYESRKFGSIGHAGAFSFNYYKNMTSGEGGGIAINDPKVFERAKCAIDPCGFYWNGRSDSVLPFAGIGARASEISGAMLNAQLDRLDGMIETMRAEKKRILAGTAHLGNLGLRPNKMNSPDYDCATQVMYLLPSADAARRFADIFPSVIASKTGRHTYTQWDQIMTGEGAAHPALNPFDLPQNKECRKSYSKDMCARSLDVLDRTVMIATHPLHSDQEVEDTIHDIGVAARVVLGDLAADRAEMRGKNAVDARKFDMKSEITKGV